MAKKMESLGIETPDLWNYQSAYRWLYSMCDYASRADLKDARMHSSDT